MLWDCFQANRFNSSKSSDHTPPRSDVLTFGHALSKAWRSQWKPVRPSCVHSSLPPSPGPTCKRVRVLPLRGGQHQGPRESLVTTQELEAGARWLPQEALRYDLGHFLLHYNKDVTKINTVLYA